jgi:lysozyme
VRWLHAAAALLLYTYLACGLFGAAFYFFSHPAHGKGKYVARQTGAAGLALIKQYEGCELTTYRCSANRCTIGFGHTGSDVKPGMTITHDRAEELLKRDLAVVEEALERLVKVPLSQPQWDAVASFVFNVGVPAFARSTMLKLINAKEHAKAAGQFVRWSHVKGTLLPGLLKRRKAEQELYQRRA